MFAFTRIMTAAVTVGLLSTGVVATVPASAAPPAAAPAPAAAAGTSPGAGTPATRKKKAPSLRIVTAGLPPGTKARVTIRSKGAVTKPNGTRVKVRKTVTAPRSIKKLPAGTYLLNAAPTKFGPITATPRKQIRVKVRAGKSATATLTFLVRTVDSTPPAPQVEPGPDGETPRDNEITAATPTLEASNITDTRVTISATNATGALNLRRTDGDTPASSVTDGVDAGTTLPRAVTGLAANSDYMFTLFADTGNGPARIADVAVHTAANRQGNQSWAPTSDTITPKPGNVRSGTPIAGAPAISVVLRDVDVPPIGGHIIIPISDAVPGGFIGLITGVYDRPDGSIRVDLTQAALDQAFDILRVNFDDTVASPDLRPAPASGLGARASGSGGSVHTKAFSDWLRCTGGNASPITVDTSFENLHAVGNIDINWADSSVDVETTIDVKADVTVGGGAGGQCELPTKPWASHTFPIGPVPFLFQIGPEFSVDFTATGGQTRHLAYRVGTKAHAARDGGAISPILQELPTPPTEGDDELDWSVSAFGGAKVFFGPGGGFGGADVAIGIEGTLGVRHTLHLNSPCRRQEAGPDMTIALNMKVFFWEGDIAKETFKHIMFSHPGCKPVTGAAVVDGASANTATVDAEQDAQIRIDGAVPGQELSVYVDNLDTIAGSAELRDARGTRIGSGSLGNDRLLHFDAGVGLNVTIPLNSVGPYTLTLNSQAPARHIVTASTPTRSAVAVDGPTKQMEIVRAGQRAKVSLDGATAGDYVSIHYQSDNADTLGSGRLMDTKLFDGNHNSIGGTNTYGGKLSTMDVVIPAGSVGPYTLWMDQDGPYVGTGKLTASTPKRTPVTVDGTPSEVSLTRPGQQAHLPVTGVVPGKRTVFHIKGTGSITFLLTHWVEDANGRRVAYGTTTNSSGGTLDADIPADAVAPFTLFMDPYQGSTGDIAVTASSVVESSSALDGASGSVHLSRAGQQGRFTLSGVQPGRSFTVATQVSGGLGSSTQTDLYNGAGNRIGGTANVSGKVSVFDVDIPANSVGPYIVTVRPNGQQAGSASVTATSIQTPQISVGGGPRTLNIARVGERAAIEVGNVTDGQRLQIEKGVSTGFGHIGATVFDSAGKYIATITMNDAASIHKFTVPSGTTGRLVVILPTNPTLSTGTLTVAINNQII